MENEKYENTPEKEGSDTVPYDRVRLFITQCGISTEIDK